MHDSPCASVAANAYGKAWMWTYHKYTPTLSVCDVARKSFVGENATLVATLGVRKASMSRPVGMSKVRMMVSSDVVTSHLESGEKVCGGSINQYRVQSVMQAGVAYQVQYTAAMTPEFSDHLLRLDINQAHYAIIAHDREQAAVALQGHR